MFGLGMQELLIVLAIVMVLFGASKLPELGKGMGSFVKNLKKGLSEADAPEVSHKEESAKADK
ncbi:Twin-arginine translocation protein TatA/E [Candidatus Magnetoovum chiemensis]|nr:Twin-arginine translocation protein TatA/E [Candidatus Magnetoovum chiemensis]